MSKSNDLSRSLAAFDQDSSSLKGNDAGGGLIGRWRIIAADVRERDYLDLIEPATRPFGCAFLKGK